jgi:Ca-activated chloride channel family protein
MKQCRIILIVSFLSVLFTRAESQEADQVIQKGNDLYKQQQYDKAESVYKEVLDKNKENTTAKFNYANSLIKQEKKSEAIKELDELAATINEKELKSKTFYNKGVILSGQQRLEESIEAYKNALRQNPNDKEARENLQKALLELKKKNPPPPPPKKENKKKKDQQKKQQQQPKMNEKEAEQRLKLLQQKEKELQERLQKQKTPVGGQQKDW